MKYIIELNPDCVDGEFLRVPIRLAGEDQWIKTKASLTPYTEPDRKDIEDDVWKFLIFLINEMEQDEKYECFGMPSAYKIVSTMSYQEAKAKYDEWKKQKNELRVGDEVLNRLGKSYVIYEIKNNSAYGIMFDEYPLSQECFSIYDSNKKTGRHFDEVEKLLEKMRGEEE